MKKTILKIAFAIAFVTFALTSCTKNQSCYEINKQIFKSKTGFEWNELQTIGPEKIDNEKMLRDYIKDSLKITPCI